MKILERHPTDVFTATMGDDSLILREDGYIRMNFPVTSLTYHSNLNIILVKTDVGGVHVLDVNSGVILQSSCLSADVGGTLGVEYVPGTDRVFVWDSSGVGARTDYNGVLLLHTALQRPLPTAHIDRSIRLELVLSEAVLLYQCLQGLDANSIEGLTDFVAELKNALDIEPVRKGVKAQKWSTVTISLPQSILRLVTTSVVQELKGQNRRIPALAIASAVGQRANELVPCSKDEETRPLMYSEAERKETFKRWALPARMAQAGFYHQPSPSGDDRAMCFTCLVCLVCWEKSDEPWVEHERHSPNCPFVRGEYTHNVPISVTSPSGDDRAMCFTCLVCLVCWEKSDEPWVEHERHSPNCPFVRGEYTHNVPISVSTEYLHRAATTAPCASPASCVLGEERRAVGGARATLAQLPLRAGRVYTQRAYILPSPSGDDRALCFTCLVCLVCWEKSDEPWVEHERHSPNCPFVRGEYTHNVPISVTSPSGDDRALCFTCLVCLVCWEKSDEPWVEHERHSPNCPFVRGEYTHNVPISGNTGEFIASGTADGKINVWTFDCGLKLVKFIHLSAYDSIFSATYGIELTAMAFVGNASQQELGWAQMLKTPPQYKENVEQDNNTKTNKTKSSLVCGVLVTRTNTPQTDVPIKEDSSKALFDKCADASEESVQAMNDQNEAKNNLSPNKMLFLLTYDIHGSQAGNVTTVVNSSNPSGNSKPGGSKKVCAVTRTDDANIYDDIYFQYSDEEPELAQCTNALIDEQISKVINLNASSSKDDCKIWEPKKIILTKHFKVVPPPPPGLLQELQEHSTTTPASVLDFVGKLSQLKSWKSGGTLDSVGTKLADQTDAVVLQQTPDPHLSHYLMTGPVDISDLYSHQSISKWYEGGEGTEKVKVTTFGGSKIGTQTAAAATNTEGFENEPVLPPPDEVTQGIAVQCLGLPPMLNLREDSKITHLIPTEDKEHLLVVVSSIDPAKIKAEDETDNDGDTKMDVDDTELQDRLKSDAKAYFILYETFDKSSMYTLEDNPVSYQELPFNESPVDLCLLPGDNDQYSFASVGIDGCLRLYSLPDFKIVSEKRVPKGQFTSVTYCASVDRLSVSTKHGMIYFYAFNNGDKDSCGDQDEDEFANIDFDMLQRAPRDEVCGPTSAPVIIANKAELDLTDLETLITLTGSYGTNTAVPYSAVVPGFWCELSPAQRPRSDHQNNRTWRLQNTSSTWDEHFLELTLPYSVSLAHVEFAFSLHSVCTTNLPVIMVTLLKQNLHGIGYKKDAAFNNRAESPIPVIDADMTNLENPIHSEEYLQAHNAEILAGPLVLSSGLDTTQQSGVLTLTSPRLYRARGRTFLIHLKTLFDPAQDMSKGPGKSEDVKGKKFIGCDWLHQISLTVRSSPHTDVPLERQQRIAMLENNSYLNTLCEIAVGKDIPEMRRLALDNIIWVISVRLQRMRLAKTEKGKDKSTESQQIECIKVIEKHIDAFIRNCVLCGDRSIAKKCTRIMLITSDGQKQIVKPWKCTFELSLCRSVANCIPYMGACVSPGALRWLAALVQHAAPSAAAPDVVQRLLDLLQHAASPLLQRADAFGLYGLPFERTIFAPETPEIGRNSAPVTYANMLQADSATPPPPRHDQQLRELLNWPKDTTPDPKTPTPWWAQNNGAGVFGLGVSEATPLHVSCHLASDGTKLESSGYRHHSAVVSALPGAAAAAPATNDPHQTKHPPGDPDPDSLEDVESTMMECDPQDKMEFSDDRLFREQEQCGIPWAALVTKPPQLTLLVERMHSGARRYIVLDFGHTVRLTDVIIPSCQDLVTLCIDIWVTSEETDGVKLAAAADIATKNLVLTDLQPPPLCRYMKIPLGWFYGEIANVSNVQASLNALSALATGKLMDLLNPYLELYNGNAAHMMAYLNMNTEGDNKVVTAYHECIELQQQLHTCTNIMKKLQNSSNTDEGRKVAEMIEKGLVTANSLLHQASTDKLRVITENAQYPDVSRDWCSTVTPLVWQCGGSTAGALATLVARVCGSERWWGDALASALTGAFAASFAPPTPLDR
ncbi:putative survivin, partial [Operophtera brumata]